MKVEYTASVHTRAGWRAVSMIAEAEKISAKRCKIVRVITIDDEIPRRYMSRTGAARQKYDGEFFADREIGTIKNLGTLREVE